MFKLYVLERHFTTSQHFLEQTRSLRWTGTKKLEGLPTNRKGFSTFEWDPAPHGSPQFETATAYYVYPALILFNTFPKPQFPAKLAIFARQSSFFQAAHFSHIITRNYSEINGSRPLLSSSKMPGEPSLDPQSLLFWMGWAECEFCSFVMSKGLGKDLIWPPLQWGFITCTVWKKIGMQKAEVKSILFAHLIEIQYLISFPSFQFEAAILPTKILSSLTWNIHHESIASCHNSPKSRPTFFFGI